MRRKVRIIAILIGLLLMGIVYVPIQQLESQIPTEPSNEVSFHNLTIKIPAGFTRCCERVKEGWQIEEYRGKGIGHLQLAIASGEDNRFRGLASRYFFMKSFPEKSEIYHARGHLYFAKNVPIVINGVYVIQTRGKGRVFTYFFSLNDTLYWISFSSGNSHETYARLFQSILSSLQYDGKPLAREGFSGMLSHVCSEGYFLFCQPTWFFFLIPVFVFFLVMSIVAAVSRRMGRLPGPETLGEVQPLYTEAYVDVLLGRRGQRSLVCLGLVANWEGLRLFSFGKLLVFIPRDQATTLNLKSGVNWLQSRYVEVSGPASSLIQRSWFVKRKDRIVIRIYSRDVDMVMSFLA